VTSDSKALRQRLRVLRHARRLPSRMLKRQRRDQKRPLFTAHGTPHLRTRSKPRWLAVRARQSCGSCAKIHLAPFSAHRVSRVVLSLLRRPTSWRGETSDPNSSPFVSGSGSLGVCLHAGAHTLMSPAETLTNKTIGAKKGP
jgi:hypothetical protein